MKKTAHFRIFALILSISLIFSAFCIGASAADEKTYVLIGDTALYHGSAPNAATFTTVYYKNGEGLGGSDSDYNAKLEYDADNGFTLTIKDLKISNEAGQYSIYSATGLNIVVLSNSKITHTVAENSKNRYAMYINGNLNISGEGRLDVVLLGKCDFSDLSSHVLFSHNMDERGKIYAIDGRSDEEKKIDSIREDLESKLSKTNYELALEKLNFKNVTAAMKEETGRVKTIAIAAVIVGAASLVANVIIGLFLVIKKKGNDDFDDED